MAYRTILTNYGLSKLAASASSGDPINLTAMAAGDGGGVVPTPNASATSLVNEVYRAAINVVQQTPGNASQYYVEFVIPAGTGGWTVREFGVFDDDGGLFAVGNFPPTYKTLPSDGAVSDLVIRAELVVSNGAIINIILDANVAVASRSWVLNTITVPFLLPGGTTGQILTKASNADGDAVWANPGSSNILVNTIEETQTVGAGQSTFTLTTVTTLGLAVYVEGVRLPRIAGADGWQQGTSALQVVLGRAYPEGHRVTFTQNEPTGLLPTPLEASRNLSDVPNKATARTNLDVYSRGESDQLAPSGQIAYTARNSPPSGWLAANGATVSRAAYSALFSVIGTTFGSGDGVTTFQLPDLRGEFIRGWDDGRGVDVGRSFGTSQSDEFRNHQHFITTADNLENTGLGQIAETGGGINASNTRYATAPNGGSETRPRNVALLAIIKF